MDSDQIGKDFQKSLKSGFYATEKEKILEMDTYTSKTGSEVEDLVPLEILVDSFDRIFKTDDGIAVSDLDEKKPVVPQLKGFADKNGLELDIGWKVELSKRVKQKFKGDVPEELENNWEELFQKLKS